MLLKRNGAVLGHTTIAVMLPGYFVVITVAISFFAGLGYLRSTIKGETQPNRVTWGLLTAIMLVIFAAQLDAGVSWPIASVSIALFNSGSIFIASFASKGAYWKSQPKDYVFGAFSIVGLVLWQISDSPEIAIAFNILADFMAWYPTIVKAYKSPNSENQRAWLLWGFAHSISVLVVKDWEFAEYSFPLYLTVGNLLVAGLITLGKRHGNGSKQEEAGPSEPSEQLQKD